MCPCLRDLLSVPQSLWCLCSMNELLQPGGWDKADLLYPSSLASTLCSDPIELLSIFQLRHDWPTYCSLCILFLYLEYPFLGFGLANTFPPFRCQLTFHFLMESAWCLETALLIWPAHTALWVSLHSPCYFWAWIWVWLVCIPLFENRECHCPQV